MNPHLDAFRKIIENAVHDFFHAALGAIKPGVDYIRTHVPDEAIAIAEGILTASIAGTPWASLTSQLLIQAEAAGISLLKEAATVALNAAQNNLIAAGTPHLVTPET